MCPGNRGKRTPEEYGCCQEDGTPCCSKQQSRQRRQRRTKVGKTLLPYSEEKKASEGKGSDESARHPDTKETKKKNKIYKSIESRQPSIGAIG